MKAMERAGGAGYFQGPTTGLERPDVNIVPLMKHADAIMLTRGILRTTVPPSLTKAVVMRCSGGPSILKELSDEELAVDIEDAIRMNVACITLQVFIGGEYETRSIKNMTRLVDMGVEPFLLASSLIGVGAQRLVRRLCMECRKPFTAKAAQLKALGFAPRKGTFFTAQGCPACNHSGYRGRTGIYELLTVDDSLRRLIHDRSSEQVLREHAVAQGMRSLRDDGMRWAAEGAISLEEVVRVTRE